MKDTVAFPHMLHAADEESCITQRLPASNRIGRNGGKHMYDSWITLKKMIYQGGIVALSGGVTALISWIRAMPEEANAVIFPILLILLKGAENYLKHRDD